MTANAFLRVSRRTTSPRNVGLVGQRPNPGRRRLIAVIGPAFVVAIAYVDPGNFATNVQAGADYGYTLLWVVLAANLMAMPVQYLSAKVGIATGRNLAELCRDRLPRPVTWGLWVQAEVVAMATDLAELVGGALALQLLFGIPLLAGGLITGAVSLCLLVLQTRGFRGFELAVAGLFGVIVVGFLYQAVAVGAPAAAVAAGFVPSLPGSGGLLLAAGIIGATVMPHVIYLHSALTQDRFAPATDVPGRRALLRLQRLDIALAMGIAGLINISMLVVAASAFTQGRLGNVAAPDANIGGLHELLGRVSGQPAALAFALALLASGLAASSVGTYAGQVVMQGFLARSVPVVGRRLLTLSPGLLVLAGGIDPTTALVYSQVLLSFGIPFALVPLVLLTRRSDVMGSMVNRRSLTMLCGAVASIITLLNVVLVGAVLTG